MALPSQALPWGAMQWTLKQLRWNGHTHMRPIGLPVSWAQATLCFQVNHSPSFTTDSRLDREVKDALLSDAINLINLRACDKKKVLEEDKRRVKERLLQAHQPPREARYPCKGKQCRDPARDASLASEHLVPPVATTSLCHGFAFVLPPGQKSC